jgi:DNA-binding NarL/FixJ family response regulator
MSSIDKHSDSALDSEGVNVVLVAMSTMILTGLRLFLSSSFNIVGEAMDERIALDMVHHHCPDIVIVAVGASHLDGVTLVQQVTRLSPHCKAIFLSLDDTKLDLVQAARSGAHGFFSMYDDINTLLPIIHMVANGDYYFGKPIKAEAFLDWKAKLKVKGNSVRYHFSRHKNLYSNTMNDDYQSAN